MFKTLIDPSALAQHLADERWVIVDCRFDLSDPPQGERLYRESHIPGARYAHLDRDLSGDKTGTNGRHPLPTADQMRERFSALGIAPGTQVVAYDADSGMYAARLWWMLRFMGHEAVAVLDGGFARWTDEGRPVRGGAEQWRPAAFRGAPRSDWLIDTAQIVADLHNPTPVLVDARAESRYRGENETIDRAAGHIPGARSFFFQRNLTPAKRFRSIDELKAEWLALLAGTPPHDAVMYCGSGVSACHNLLALEHAGLTGARLYSGSWSEWSSSPDRPIATGGS
jgi:thiosulfate/3-mercaptopyruvate sulfurtransferase